jgi:hypothetical protein
MDNSLGVTYRFAVVDFSRSKSFPQNFVCMLPVKVNQDNRKVANVFGGLFGEKSVDFAMELLNKALKNESDTDVKAEIERRLKLIDPKQVNLVRCSRCRTTFQSNRIKKYKRNYCKNCLKARYGPRINC